MAKAQFNSVNFTEYLLWSGIVQDGIDAEMCMIVPSLQKSINNGEKTDFFFQI
jgi:hypothetical protein